MATKAVIFFIVMFVGIILVVVGLSIAVSSKADADKYHDEWWNERENNEWWNDEDSDAFDKMAEAELRMVGGIILTIFSLVITAAMIGLIVRAKRAAADTTTYIPDAGGGPRYSASGPLPTNRTPPSPVLPPPPAQRPPTTGYPPPKEESRIIVQQIGQYIAGDRIEIRDSVVQRSTIGGHGNENGNASSRIASDAHADHRVDTAIDPRDRDALYDGYKRVLAAALDDGVITEAEAELLAKVREHDGITLDDHQRAYMELLVERRMG